MKLYYAPGACSLSPHIALREAGLDVELVKVDLGTKKTAAGDDFTQVNPNGYVPALKLDSGEVLTEGPAITQYIADRVPAKQLAPANGTLARYQLQSWLNFITSELHKSFSPLFNPNASKEMREAATANLHRRFDAVARQLSDRPYLTGDTFTIADGYLFTVLNWTHFVKMDLAKWPALQQFLARVAERPAVQQALKAEGLA